MDGLITISLALHVFATLSLVGLIWFVQVVHYPLMSAVARDRFRQFEADHCTRTTWVVAPLMLTEAATAVVLMVLGPDGVGWLAWCGLALLVVIWASTYLLQVPAHQRLSRAYDAGVHRFLVRSNWLRTAAWSLRGILVLAWVT